MESFNDDNAVPEVKSLFVDKSKLGSNYVELRKYLPPNYELETSEFSEDFEKMSWVDYCVRYCIKCNKIDSCLDYYVARYKDKDNHWQYSIVRKEY